MKVRLQLLFINISKIITRAPPSMSSNSSEFSPSYIIIVELVEQTYGHQKDTIVRSGTFWNRLTQGRGQTTQRGLSHRDLQNFRIEGETQLGIASWTLGVNLDCHGLPHAVLVVCSSRHSLHFSFFFHDLCRPLWLGILAGQEDPRLQQRDWS